METPSSTKRITRSHTASFMKRTKEELFDFLDSEKTRHFRTENQLSCKIQELTLLNEDLQKRVTVLEEGRRKEQADESVEDTNKRLQAYNTSLQQHNSNLQADAVKDGDTITKLQKDKSVMVVTFAKLREHSSSLKDQLDTVRLSQQEAIKENDKYKKEVDCLRSELQQVRMDRDQQLEQVQLMTMKLKKHEELKGKFCRDIDVALTKASTLEETCSSQQD